jgi:hypothetical protein
VRCPFCHDALAPASDDWVACAGCLARHHPACWRESGACGTCGWQRSLAPAPEEPVARVLPRRAWPRLGSVILVVALPLSLLLNAVAVARLQPEPPPAPARAETFRIGDDVECERDHTWWPGVVTGTSLVGPRVRLVGWGGNLEEWVAPDRVRRACVTLWAARAKLVSDRGEEWRGEKGSTR